MDASQITPPKGASSSTLPPTNTTTTPLSKKQLRQEKSKASNSTSPGTARRASSSAAATAHTTPEDDPAAAADDDLLLPAYDRVRRLHNLDAFQGDVEDHLTELIDRVLAPPEGEARPHPAKRDELARLLLWHAEFRAGETGVSTADMRGWIADAGACLGKALARDPKGEGAAYQALIKVYGMRRKQMEARRRRRSSEGGGGVEPGGKKATRG